MIDLPGAPPGQGPTSRIPPFLPGVGPLSRRQFRRPGEAKDSLVCNLANPPPVRLGQHCSLAGVSTILICVFSRRLSAVVR